MQAVNAQDLCRKPQTMRDWHSVVLMQGEEPYFLDKLGRYLEENLVDPEARDFNQTVLYGKECDAESILSAAKLFPFMSSKRLVLVREAQQLPDKEWEKLLSYLLNPLESTLLVLMVRGKNLDRRKKAFKALETHGRIVQSNPLKDQNLGPWLDETIRTKGYTLNPQAKALLLDFVGNQLTLLDTEVEKLSLNLQPGSSIEAEHVEKYVGISREYNVFELQDALGEQDEHKAYSLALHLGLNPKASNFSLPLCVSTLYTFYQKINLTLSAPELNPQALASLIGVHPYFATAYRKYARNFSETRLRKCFKLLLEYDLKAKGLGQGGHLTEAELTRELIQSLLLSRRM